MIKKILMLVAFLLLTVSCIETPGVEEATGTEGVKVDFMDNYPPSTIYENNALEVVLELRNKGSFDEPDGKITLHGYDSSVVSFSGEYVEDNYIEANLPALSASSEHMPEGDYETQAFEATESAVRVEGGDRYSTDLIASICYLYRTSTSPTICVAPPQTSAEEMSCTPQTISMQSHGGPIAITEITPQVVSDKLEITAIIEHKGEGEVLTPRESTYERCPFQLEQKDYDRVSVNMSIGRFPEPECDDNIVSLRNGEGIVRCVFEAGDIDPTGYTTQINVETDYLYKEQTTESIDILSLD